MNVCMFSQLNYKESIQAVVVVAVVYELIVGVREYRSVGHYLHLY